MKDNSEWWCVKEGVSAFSVSKSPKSTVTICHSNKHDTNNCYALIGVITGFFGGYLVALIFCLMLIVDKVQSK